MRSPFSVPIRRFWAGAALLGAMGGAIGAQTSARTPSASGVYTAEQAERGARIYTERCSPCHTIEQFTGPAFLLSWGGQPALNLFALIRTTMPTGSPASLKRQEYADVLAYLLRENGLPAGPTELAATDAALKKIIIEIPKKSPGEKGR